MSAKLELIDVFTLDVRAAPTSVIVGFVGGTNYGVRSGFRGIEPPGPIQLKIRQGRKLHDFLFVDGISLVVSEKVVTLFESKKFRGWHKVPALVRDRQNEPVSIQYFGIMITGRAGPQDQSRQHDIRFNPETWDGTELFLLADTNTLFVTRPVAEALGNSDITGYSVTPIVRS